MADQPHHQLSSNRYQVYRQALQGEALPLAWLDLDALAANAQWVLDQAAAKPVRLVSKSLRSVSALRWLLQQHPRFQGLLCYHPAEAVQLSRQGFDDLLVAYPSMQHQALSDCCQQTAAGKRLVLMLDCLPQAQMLDSLARAAGVCQPVCLDIDLSLQLPGLCFGVHRSPLNSVARVLELYGELRKLRHLRLVGVMGYEAQVAGMADQLPGKTLQNLALPLLKQASIAALRKLRQQVVTALRDAGAELQFVNGGGSGSITSTVADSSVTEVAVGSAFYAPHWFDHYRDLPLTPAAGFALEVSRKPSAHWLTCSGGGYVASGAAGPEKLPQPWLPAGLRLDHHEGAGEVQTPLCGAVGDLALGDPVLFRHAKAGELCERFNELLVLTDGSISERWRTYRGEGWAFV